MKSTKSKLNVKLLRRIKRHILTEPRRLVMADVKVKGKPGDRFKSDNGGTQILPDCGTAACIAGWALMISGKRVIEGSANLYRAAKLLSLPEDFRSNNLFIVEYWPHRLRRRYLDADAPEARAKIAADRIEHLIKTGE